MITPSFRLTGAHLTIQCIDCHSSGYQNMPTDCYSCHSGNYNSVPDPNHVQDNFSQICTQCHTTAAWLPATFRSHSIAVSVNWRAYSHSLVFPVTHRDLIIRRPNAIPAITVDYQNVSDPNHVQNNFDHVCTQCHTTTAWSPATFNHTNTQFPLTGAHVSLQCLSHAMPMGIRIRRSIAMPATRPITRMSPIPTTCRIISIMSVLSAIQPPPGARRHSIITIPSSR